MRISGGDGLVEKRRLWAGAIEEFAWVMHGQVATIVGGDGDKTWSRLEASSRPGDSLDAEKE